MLSLSRLRTLDLYINTPRWRLMVAAHTLASLLALLAIVSYGSAMSSPKTLDEASSQTMGWTWGNGWLESLAFVPPIATILWAIIAVSYLLFTTHAMHPSYEMGIELCIVVINIFPIAFCFSVNGPMQSMINTSTNAAQIAGSWEIAGLSGLILLEILSFTLCLWAWRRLSWRKSMPADDGLDEAGDGTDDDNRRYTITSSTFDISRERIPPSRSQEKKRGGSLKKQTSNSSNEKRHQRQVSMGTAPLSKAWDLAVSPFSPFSPRTWVSDQSSTLAAESFVDVDLDLCEKDPVGLFYNDVEAGKPQYHQHHKKTSRDTLNRYQIPASVLPHNDDAKIFDEPPQTPRTPPRATVVIRSTSNGSLASVSSRKLKRTRSFERALAKELGFDERIFQGKVIIEAEEEKPKKNLNSVRKQAWSRNPSSASASSGRTARSTIVSQEVALPSPMTLGKDLELPSPLHVRGSVRGGGSGVRGGAGKENLADNGSYWKIVGGYIEAADQGW